MTKTSKSEQVILLSAIQKKGIFTKKCEFIHRDEKGTLIFDGNFIYPLGDLNINIDKLSEIPFTGILGRSTNVQKILKLREQKDYLVMNKEFAVLDKTKTRKDIPLTNNLTIDIVKTTDQLQQFCILKNMFLFEESGHKSDTKALFNSLKNDYSALFPTLLNYKGETIGIVSSNFSSDYSSMINTLFIKKDFRNKGYGKILLEYYINFLLKHSKNICLFYSPNSVAQKIYEKLGFKKSDEWGMAVNKGL